MSEVSLHSPPAAASQIAEGAVLGRVAGVWWGVWGGLPLDTVQRETISALSSRKQKLPIVK